MKRFPPTTLVVIALLLVAPSFAQEVSFEFVAEQRSAPPDDLDLGYEEKGAGHPSLCAGCGNHPTCCGCGPTWYAEFEAMSMRYRRSDGTTYDVSNPNAEFDFGRQLIPRVTAGAVLNSGLGVRLRYFDYDHGDTNTDGVAANVEANVIDLELFENLRLTTNTAVEWSIGVRRNEFVETVAPHPLVGDDVFGVDFQGVGLVAGLEVNRMLHWGSVYARGRGALLTGDRDVMAPGAGHPQLVQQNITPGMLEFAVGWEFSHVCHNGVVLTSGIGWEVQQWMDHSLAAPTALPGTTSLDIGFDGAIFSFAVGF